MRFIRFITVTLGLFTSSIAAELTEKEKADGWTLLFNGKNFDGWRNYNGEGVREGWKVEDGQLIHTKGGGDIITVDQYENFDLRLEWKVSEGGNSGIFIGARETKQAIYFTAIEMQVLDDERHSDAAHEKHRAGACYALYTPPKDAVKPAMQWNQVRILKQGSHIQFFLNGTKTADFDTDSDDFKERVANSKFKDWKEFAKYSKGHIGLQDHGDLVSFRNIKLRPL